MGISEIEGIVTIIVMEIIAIGKEIGSESLRLMSMNLLLKGTFLEYNNNMGKIW